MENLLIYCKSGKFLLESKKFVYEKSIYCIHENGANLIESEIIENSKIMRDVSKVITKNDEIFLVIIEMFSAPINYLNKENFEIYSKPVKKKSSKNKK